MEKLKDKTPEQALARLMAICSKSEKSSGDALRLMWGWGIAPAERDKIVRKLIAERFIDDARYAAAFVREKTRLNGWGAHKIGAALSAKGVARAIINDALGEIDPRAAQERLDRYLRTKLSRLSGTPYEIREKLMRYGASLGYDYETVSDAIGKLIREES